MSYIELLLLFYILILFGFSRSGKKVYYLLKKSIGIFFCPLKIVFLIQQGKDIKALYISSIANDLIVLAQ